MLGRRLLLACLLGAVALAFADSSIVVLALPDMIDAFGASIGEAAGVIVSYNLALAALLAVVVLTRRSPGGARTARVGLVVFLAASAACAVAPGMWALVVLRGVQGLGAGLLLPASFVLARSLAASPARGAAAWSVAAVAGTAIGPAVGGALTDFFDWRSIFIAGLPVAALALVATMRPAPREEIVTGAREGATHRTLANVALALVSAALVALLFLAVLLLVNVWGLSPLAAAAVVSVVPASMLLARFVQVPLPAALFLLAAGLAALGLVPDRRLGWAIAALAVAGAGLGPALTQLDRLATDGAPSATGAATHALLARHAGLVVGLLLLTPLLAADLAASADTASRSATATVLEAPVPARAKARLAADLAPALAKPGRESLGALIGGSAGRGPEAQLARAIDDGVRASITRAFRRSFLVAAALALCALGLAAFFGAPRRLVAYAAPAAAAAALLGAELGAGGLAYGGGPPATPCAARGGPPGDTLDLILQRAALRGLDAIACRAGTSREELVLDAAGATQDAVDQARQVLAQARRLLDGR